MKLKPKIPVNSDNRNGVAGYRLNEHEDGKTKMITDFWMKGPIPVNEKTKLAIDILFGVK